LDKSPEAVARGIQFQDNYDYARSQDPAFIFVYSWNEWLAQRFLSTDKKSTYFADEFNIPFSKDIEPMTTDEPGSIGDNYYYQLVANDRRFLGVRPLPAVTPGHVNFHSPFSAWANVGPEFHDDIGDPVHRDFGGWSKSLHYVNQTGRNDIVAAKVSYDKQNVYFYVRTTSKLSPHTAPNWMLLYLDTDSDYKTGWLGYDYVLNRQVGSATTSLEKNVGNQYQWAPVGQVKYHAVGNQLMIAIPHSLLGGKLPSAIDFKWADNCFAKGDWTDFTLNGDAAPNDRFNYHAELAAGH